MTTMQFLGSLDGSKLQEVTVDGSNNAPTSLSARKKEILLTGLRKLSDRLIVRKAHREVLFVFDIFITEKQQIKEEGISYREVFLYRTQKRRQRCRR